MKKRILAVFLSALLILCATGGAAFTGASQEALPVNTFPIDKQMQELMEKQQPSADAFTEILGNFQKDETGDFVYPDEYGGAHYDETDNKLCICLTDTSDVTVSKYIDYSKKSDYIKFRKVEHSYNELENIMNTIHETRDKYDTITLVGIDERNNGIIVRVNSERLAETKNAIQSVLTAELGLSKKELPQITVEFGEINSPTADLRGGMKIVNTDINMAFTLGICGTYQGYPAFITAGHGGMELYDVFRLYSSSGTVLGMVQAVQFAHNQYYDYAIVRVTNTSQVNTTNQLYTTSNSPSTTTQMTAAATDYRAQGYAVFRFGSATAANNSGDGLLIASVTYPNTIVNYDNISVIGMTEAEIIDGTSTKGDSGGPIYVANTFYGIQTAHSTTANSIGVGGYIYYSPIHPINGFTVQTSP